MNEKRVEVGLLDRGVREKKLKDLRVAIREAR